MTDTEKSKSLITNPDHPWRTSDPDIHPESFCHRCRGRNISWFAPDYIWVEVMRDGDVNNEKWKWNEIICPLCFYELAREKGYVFCEVDIKRKATYKNTLRDDPDEVCDFCSQVAEDCPATKNPNAHKVEA
jgi:hypothetical protein